MRICLLHTILLIVSLGISVPHAYAYTDSLESFTGYQSFSAREFEKISINGPADLKNISIVSGSITGDLEFEDLMVKKTLDVAGHVFGSDGTFHKLHVIGSVRLTKSHLDYLEVTGHTTLKNCSITKTTNVVGFFKATNSILDEVDVTVNSIVLHDSKAGAIIVRRSNTSAEQKLILINSSAKSVIFESGNGKIVVRGNGEITGKIKGAIIVQE